MKKKIRRWLFCRIWLGALFEDAPICCMECGGTPEHVHACPSIEACLAQIGKPNRWG